MSKYLYTGLLALVLAFALVGQSIADPRVIPISTGITTDTTSGVKAVDPVFKTFFGQVVCSSGACTQTQAIYGDFDTDAANGILLCTITLSATTAAYDACPPISANFKYFYVVTTSTSGTSATGAVYAMY